MIVVTDTPGQLGNQLWAYTNMIAIAKECNTNIVILLSRQFYDMFDANLIGGHKEIKIYPHGSFRAKRIKWAIGFFQFRFKTGGRVAGVLKRMPVSLVEEFVNEKVFKSTLKKRHVYFTRSWQQRANKDFFLKHSEFIRHLFVPQKSIVMAVADNMKILRAQYEMIIGVHIRRGDYKEYMNGCYYFNDATYESYMQLVQGMFPGKKTLFYIFSNEQVDVSSFKHLQVYFKNDQSAIYDLWAMRSCDLLMGPPSTFTMWASFWNKVPLRFLQNATEKLTVDQFRPVLAQDIFQES